MLGILLKVTTKQAARLANPKLQNKSLRVDKVALNKIRAARRSSLDGFAVLGITEEGQSRLVTLTAKLHSITLSQPELNLKFVREWQGDNRWCLPHGFGDSADFQFGGGEMLDSEEDVLACLLRSPSALLSSAVPKMPAGFHWKPSAAAHLVIDFDALGQVSLRARPAYDRQIIGGFFREPTVLNGIWAKMSGHDFQVAMCELFSLLGFQVKNSKQGPDGGIDLTLQREDGIIGSDRYAVQCKRYDSSYKVHTPTIDQIRGVANKGNMQRGILVTTSGFTDPAYKVAAGEGIPIELIDGKKLSSIVLPRLHQMPTVLKFL